MLRQGFRRGIIRQSSSPMSSATATATTSTTTDTDTDTGTTPLDTPASWMHVAESMRKGRILNPILIRTTTLIGDVVASACGFIILTAHRSPHIDGS